MMLAVRRSFVLRVENIGSNIDIITSLGVLAEGSCAEPHLAKIRCLMVPASLHCTA